MSLEAATSKIPEYPVWRNFNEAELYIPNEEERTFHQEKPKLFYGYKRVKADEILKEHCIAVLSAYPKNSLRATNSQKILKEGIGMRPYILFLENLKRVESSKFPYFYISVDENNQVRKTFSGGIKIKSYYPELNSKSTAVLSKQEYGEIKRYI